MKFSKSAMRAHHARGGHLTQVEAVETAAEPPRPARPRTYSTERHCQTPNGIVVPEQIRTRIETSVPNLDQDSDDRPQSFSGWGFF